MEKLPPPEPSVAKTVRLPASMWEEIDALRRTLPGKVPSEPATVRMLVRRALDLLARPRWQPIETAPRDGTAVLLWDGQEVFLGSWHSSRVEAYPFKEGWWIDAAMPEHMQAAENPTHWRPLPEPPAVT